MTYVRNLFIAVDQLFAAMFGLSPDITLSAYIGYKSWKNNNEGLWRWLEWMVDTLFWFQTNHCYESFIYELLRKDLPDEWRDIADEMYPKNNEIN
jgi:hypothetical protein